MELSSLETPMRILQVHNQYQSGWGGEDIVVESERALLVEHGHMVDQYFAANIDLGRGGILQAIRSGIEAMWSVKHYKGLYAYIAHCQPDLVHVHNTFATLSPGVFWAIARSKVPCVFTLHNYRLACPVATLFRNHQPCEACIGRLPLPAFQHRCRYNGSLAATGIVAATQILHHMIGTYKHKINAFVVLNTQFADIARRAGIPAQKIHIKWSSVADKSSSMVKARKNQFVFVGQLAAAKGLELLLEAWTSQNRDDTALLIIGNGPQYEQLQAHYSGEANIRFMGKLEQTKAFEVIAESRFLIMPSLWYEPQGLASVEALMLGTPVIVPGHIALAAPILEGGAGLVYGKSNPTELAQTLEQAQKLDVEQWRLFSARARKVYLTHFAPEKSYQTLISLYESILNSSATTSCDYH